MPQWHAAVSTAQKTAARSTRAGIGAGNGRSFPVRVTGALLPLLIRRSGFASAGADMGTVHFMPMD
jgi:hypothetical protein